MPKSYESATVEFAMTLSTLAYVDENRTATQQQMIGEINAGLEEAGYKSWQVAWGPALNADRSNLAYAARNSETGQLAVSIRGSDFSSGSTGLKTSQRSDLCLTTSLYQPPARLRRSPLAPPLVSGRFWECGTERKVLRHSSAQPPRGLRS